jgi:hypothetical protein
MHFGIFMEFESRQGRSQTESFREGFELVEAADAWAWMVCGSGKCTSIRPVRCWGHRSSWPVPSPPGRNACGSVWPCRCSP